MIFPLAKFVVGFCCGRGVVGLLRGTDDILFAGRDKIRDAGHKS
jgi:hypothetical protein